MNGLIFAPLAYLSIDGPISPDRKEARASIQVILDTVNRIANITRGLRTFARDAELDPPDDTPVSQIIRDALLLCQERLKQCEQT